MKMIICVTGVFLATDFSTAWLPVTQMIIFNHGMLLPGSNRVIFLKLSCIKTSRMVLYTCLPETFFCGQLYFFPFREIKCFISLISFDLCCIQWILNVNLTNTNTLSSLITWKG